MLFNIRNHTTTQHYIAMEVSSSIISKWVRNYNSVKKGKNSSISWAETNFTTKQHLFLIWIGLSVCLINDDLIKTITWASNFCLRSTAKTIIIITTISHIFYYEYCFCLSLSRWLHTKIQVLLFLRKEVLAHDCVSVNNIIKRAV